MSMLLAFKKRAIQVFAYKKWIRKQAFQYFFENSWLPRRLKERFDFIWKVGLKPLF